MLQDWALIQHLATRSNVGQTLVQWAARRRFAIALGVALAAVFVYRMNVLRSHVALGLDAGDYLKTMHQLFGTDAASYGLTRPPLVGIALWPLAQLFGPLEATKLLAVAASVLVGVPFYLLCSRFTGRAVAVAVSIPFVFSLKYMTALNWGFLTLVCVGLFTVCFYLIYEILAAPSLRRGMLIALGLTSLALVAANRSSALIYVLTVLTFGAVVLIAGGHLRKRALTLLAPAVLAVLLSLPFLSTYFRVSFAVVEGQYLSVAHSTQDLRAGWDVLRYFFPADQAYLWGVIVLLSLVGALMLFRRNPLGWAVLLTLFFVPFGLSMLTVGTIAMRSGYYLYLPVWLGFAIFADAVIRAARRGRAPLAQGSVLVVAVMVFLAAQTMWKGHSLLPAAAEYYGYLTSDHATAIRAVDRDAPAGAGVAYPWGLGQWAGGATGRLVYYGRSSALALLAGERVTTNGYVFIAEAYVAEDVPMDPALGIDNGELKRLVYLDDRLIEIEYGSDRAPRRVTLAEAELQYATSDMIEHGVFMGRRTYVLDGLRVIKEVTLPEHSGRATVTLGIESESGPVSRVVVPVQTALPPMSASHGPQRVAFGFKGRFQFADNWTGGVHVDLLDGEGGEATLTLLSDQTIALAEVRPGSPQTDVTLTLAFTFEARPYRDAAGLRLFSAEDIIREKEIRFALVDKHPATKPRFGDSPDAATLDWLERSPYFRPLRDDGDVATYLVIPPSADEGAEP